MIAALVEQLQRVCREVATGPRAAKELCAELGTTTVDHGGNLQIEFRPRDAAFARGEVIRRYGSDDAAAVWLWPAEGLTLADLRPAFGATSGPQRTSPHGPPTALFSVDTPDTPYRVTLVAQMGEDDVVAALVLRRDPPRE